MQRIPVQAILIVAIALAGTLASGYALAEKPARAGKEEKASKHKQSRDEPQAREQERGAASATEGKRFDDRQRAAVRDYFAKEFRAGRCPPGLAKKSTGCLPPGQAKKWAIGQALPRDVVYDELPAKVRSQLGTPPAGHRYVRVASDILLIAEGTGLVMDAIEDLGRM